MSNEEFQRKMDFIVEQQAQFVSDMHVLRESQAQLQATQAQTEQVVVQTEQVVARLAYVTHVGFNDVNAKINALVDAQIRNEEQMKLSDERFNAKLALSDERFNARMDAMNASFNAKMAESDQRFNEKFAESDQRFNAKLAESDQRFNAKLAESDQRFNEKMDRLSEAQAKTDESLRNLIEGQNRPRLRANGGEPEKSDHEH